MNDIRVWFETQTAIFVTLQLCGLIDWSWWWLLSPIWIGALLLVPANILLRWAARRWA